VTRAGPAQASRAGASRPGRADTIAVIGSGSLARAVCRWFAAAAGADLPAGEAAEVVMMARSASAARDACLIAGGLAGLASRPVRFRHVPADLASPSGLAEALRAAHPAGVVLCASYQSPWEGQRAPSAWTEALSRAGFGLSLPLQVVPALRAGRAIAEVCPQAWLVNSCFPDAVNPVLAQLGVPVTCGGGNVAMLGAALQHSLGVTRAARLKVVAHHAHLHAPPDPAGEALAWLDDTPVADVTAALREFRAAPREQLADLAGASTAQLAWALLTGTEVETHAPGPLGLPGGYPVRIADRMLSLRLPSGLTQAQAVAINQDAALRDGVMVTDGMVTFGPAARAVLEKELPCLAGGVKVSDITSACDRLLELRNRLRRQPRLEVDRDR
jgi:hypothetical protein